MEGEEGGGIRLSKRFSDKGGSGEVDYKDKAGTAWSHSYLNQKPWHPLSYPNQRRKWIAEQTHAQRQRRSEEVAREYAQEQEFFRQTALISKKEKEKVEMMKAVSFMYVRPPGYNAESAKAAEIADEMKREEGDNPTEEYPRVGTSTERAPESITGRDRLGEEKKKPRPKDVFGRPLPTEEEFEVLKNAPRLETGLPARAKPFGVELRNVKCVRCGTHGHQSGDRECPLKDAIMPNEQSRLKRDDPLTAILAQIDPSEPLKWELKQKPGISPPRGGFKLDDLNQQIVAEDIFDEYGGFLSGGIIPELLTNVSSRTRKKKSSKKRKHKRKRSSSKSRKSKDPQEDEMFSHSHERKGSRKTEKSKKKTRRNESSSLDTSEIDGNDKQSRSKRNYSSEDPDSDLHHRTKKRGKENTYSSDDSIQDRHERSDKRRSKRSNISNDPESDMRHRTKRRRKEHSYFSEDSDTERHQRSDKKTSKYSYSSEDCGEDSNRRRDGREGKRYASTDSDDRKHRRCRRGCQKRSYLSQDSEQRYSKNDKRRH